MAGKQFSINDAERLLPTLSPLVLRAQRLKTTLEEYEDVSLRRRIMTDGTEEDLELPEPLDAEHQALKEEFYKAVDRVNSHGCILRDVEQGVVDFATRFEGRDVFLNWRLGETRITHWHENEDNVAGRKRILELR